MRYRDDEDAADRFRLGVGTGGVVMVTLFLLMAQLQLDTAALFVG